VDAYRIVLTARGVGLTPAEGLSTVWDGDFELAGRGARAHVAGELRLLRGRYTGDLAPPARAAGPAGGEAALPALPLRLAVRLDDNLVIRNRTATLRIGGSLAIEGTTAAPAVFGTLEGREGAFVFRGRRFTVVSASARFADPRRIDPFLDLDATARIREYDVTVRVTGQTDTLDIRLTSTPPLAQDELLALVAFGTTRAQLERSAVGVLAAEAARLLVGDLFGVEPETADLDESLLDRGGASGTPVQLATRVGERTTVGHVGNLQSERDQRLRVEYELLGPLRLIGEQGLDGRYAAGVVLRLRFR
jgi:translocation and assembly module TamB